MKIVAGEPSFLPRAHSTLTDQLKSLCSFKKFTSFRIGSKEQGEYLSNTLDIIGTMMFFMRATRQKLWGLHIASFDRFSPYFFALDLGNYA